jgi:hypothetical protein
MSDCAGAQVVGSFSRIGLSCYMVFPPNQTGTFSDSGALNRAVQRPANAFDAFRRAAEEGLSGLWSGISGTVMDPTQVSVTLSRKRKAASSALRHLACLLRGLGWHQDDVHNKEG